MYNKADVRSWLDRAKDDLRFAEAGIKDGFYSQPCFLAQQAAEKAIKALIYSKEPNLDLKQIKELKTHNLPFLLKKVKPRGTETNEEITISVKTLNKYYLPTRYPDIPDVIGSYTKEIASDALEKAREIVRFVEENLKSQK